MAVKENVEVDDSAKERSPPSASSATRARRSLRDDEASQKFCQKFSQTSQEVVGVTESGRDSPVPNEHNNHGPATYTTGHEPPLPGTTDGGSDDDIEIPTAGNMLREVGNSIEDFVSFENKADLEIWESCPTASCEAIKAFEGEGMLHKPRAHRKYRRDMVRAIYEPILAVFLLPHEDSQLKLYHGLATLLRQHFDQALRYSDEDVGMITESLCQADGISELLATAQTLASYQYTRTTLLLRTDLGTIDKFRGAYHELVLGLVCATEARQHRGGYHFRRSRRLLTGSFYETIDQLPLPQLQIKETVGSRGLLMLLLRRCVGGVIPGNHDIIDLFKQLIHLPEVWNEEPSCESLKAFRPLRNELAAAAIVLQQQSDVLAAMEGTLAWRMTYDAYKLMVEYIHKDLVNQANFRDQTMANLDDLCTELRVECEAQAADLEDWRSNTAIIFTTVTTIFLPLSVVAGIFGMNTLDV
ncbi:hypothetical protein LTR62_005526 [Meristemomyces frigidus]|uniref:Magnesium transporter n=1 Tax=Meristemomyces frigidus TaxID=1508187 RepID=A0AAN7TD34_9PEZI|nr:hypothetical protein LTR62_005526 [Meristemomyces frigidus]